MKPVDGESKVRSLNRSKVTVVHACDNGDGDAKKRKRVELGCLRGPGGIKYSW